MNSWFAELKCRDVSRSVRNLVLALDGGDLLGDLCEVPSVRVVGGDLRVLREIITRRFMQGSREKYAE